MILAYRAVIQSCSKQQVPCLEAYKLFYYPLYGAMGGYRVMLLPRYETLLSKTDLSDLSWNQCLIPYFEVKQC